MRLEIKARVPQTNKAPHPITKRLISYTRTSLSTVSSLVLDLSMFPLETGLLWKQILLTKALSAIRKPSRRGDFETRRSNTFRAFIEYHTQVFPPCFALSLVCSQAVVGYVWFQKGSWTNDESMRVLLSRWRCTTTAEPFFDHVWRGPRAFFTDLTLNVTDLFDSNSKILRKNGLGFAKSQYWRFTFCSFCILKCAHKEQKDPVWTQSHQFF